MTLRTRSNIGRLAVFVTATTAAGLFGLGTAAHAEEPIAEFRTVTTHVTNHTDNGNGTPSGWAVDDFTRLVQISGGPNYVLPETPSVEAPEAVQAAEEKKENPHLDVCDLTKRLHLVWNYVAKVVDQGTFVTNGSATGSPGAGVALADGVPGTFSGSFTATFTAPAHWCTFDSSDFNNQTISGDKPKTSDWVKSLFKYGFKGKSLNDDWTWTYKTCVEQWVDAFDNGAGTDEGAGDITGLPCPTPTPTPVPTTAPPVVVVAAQLPVTGASVTTVVAAGVGLVLLGAAVLFFGRRRRTV